MNYGSGASMNESFAVGAIFRAPKTIHLYGKKIRRANRIVIVEIYDDGKFGVDVFKRSKSRLPVAWAEINADRLNKLRRLGGVA